MSHADPPAAATPSHEPDGRDVREVTVPGHLGGTRLDKALGELVPDLSRARIRRAVDLGVVRVNGRRAPKGSPVAAGDVVRIDVGQVAEAPAVASPGAPLRILYETPQVLVVDKPAGQPTSPLRPGETGTLVNAVLAHCPELVPAADGSFIGHAAREPGVIHRLDTDTSGAVVVARTAEAFVTLKAGLKDGQLDKRYLLVCSGEGLPDEGSIEIPLANHPKDQRRVYACVHPRDVMRYEPRPAVTRYRVVERGGPWALVEAIAPKALRHQIRAHFAAIEHPLVCDELYGGPVVRAVGRHALHASHVAWPGGGGVEPFSVDVPVPREMAALVAPT